MWMHVTRLLNDLLCPGLAVHLARRRVTQVIKVLSIVGPAALLAAGAAIAGQDAPVALDPLRQSFAGYMFDWIFFAIVVPIPLLLYIAMRRGNSQVGGEWK
jgi:hypothetical protein